MRTMPNSRVRGKERYSFRYQASYWAARRFLKELLAHYNQVVFQMSAEPAMSTWLVPFRTDLREICSSLVPGQCRWLLEDCDPRTRPIVVWLASQHASRFSLLGIDDHSDDPSPVVRKHVAKALRRLEAWPQLAEMAKRWPDDQAVVWFAFPGHRARPFSSRMEGFVHEHVDASRAESIPPTSQMTLWVHETINWFNGKPAKSRAFIRQVLERIHALVRGDIR